MDIVFTACEDRQTDMKHRIYLQVVLCLLAESIRQPKVEGAKVCIERLINLNGANLKAKSEGRSSFSCKFGQAIEKAVNTAELLTSSLSMQYVIELDAMPDRCNPSAVFKAAMYKRPGIISTACARYPRLSKACRRES